MKMLEMPPMPPLIRERTIEDVPEDVRAHMTVKIFLFGTLAWDYVGTTLDICSEMRIAKTRKICRAIRELHSDYEYMRRECLDDNHIENEQRLAELFEEINREHIVRLCNGLIAEINRDYNLTTEWRMLVQSVQMAMTVIDALMLYVDECNHRLQRFGVRSGRITPPRQFRQLQMLLPEIAGDCYQRHSESRRITSKILFNELKNIELYDDEGKF